MKIVLLPIFILLTFASTGQSNKKSKVEPGVYKLFAQKYSDGQRDTIISGFELINIYTSSFYQVVTLWQNNYVEFGIARYNQSGSQLAHHWFYTVWIMDSLINLTVEVALTDSGYNQKLRNIPNQDKKATLSEAYSTVPAVGISDLDGAWKINKSLVIKAGDTVINKI